MVDHARSANDGPDPVELLDLPPLLTLAQARKAAGVSSRTIYNWMNKGLVEWVLTAGGSRRIVAASLFRMQAQAQAVPAGPAAADAKATETKE